MPVAEEAPITTSSLNTKESFLDDQKLNQDWEAALKADGKLSPTAPSEGAPEVPPVTDKPAAIAPPEPPKPEPTPTPTPKPEGDDDIPTDIKSPAAQSSWKKLKDSKKAIETERDSIRKERDSLRSEFEALKKTAATPAQKASLADDPEYQAIKKTLEAKDKELADYSERLRLVEVEKHPKFEQHFKAKVEAQMAIAKDIGGEALMEALQLPAGALRKERINALAAEMDPVSLSQLGSVMTRLTEIETEKAGEIQKARESYQQIQTEQKLQAEKQQAEIKNLFQRVTEDVTDKERGLSVFHEREGDEEWNKGVRERMGLVERAFKGEFKPEEAIRAMYWAAAAPTFAQHNRALLEQVAELQATVQSLRAASPNPGGGSAEVSDKEKYVPGLEGMMQELEKVMPGAR